MLVRGIQGELRYRAYRRNNKDGDCALCIYDASVKDRTVLEATDTMVVLENDYPYKRWAYQKVASHLMTVPKRHVLKISELTPQENTEMMQLTARYDEKGYSFYIRSFADKFRSVSHIHGHLFSYK